jgi:DNA-directed RNA polymerase specialized sigma24 family protein
VIPDPPRSEAVASLLLELRPRVQRIVAGFGIPAAEAEVLLRQTLLALLRHWHKVESPTAWLLATFEEKCSVYSRRHPAADPDPERTEISDPEPGAIEPAPEHSDVWLDLERTLEAVRECLAEGDEREARARAARAGEAAPESSGPPATRERHRR